MRNVRAVNLLNKLIYLTKNSNLTSSRLLGSLSNSHATVGVGGAQTHEPKFSQSRRHSSSGGGHGGHGSAGFGSSGIIYTLLGASLTGGAIAVFVVSGSEKKAEKKQVTPRVATAPAAASSVNEDSEPEEQPPDAAAVADEQQEEVQQREESPEPVKKAPEPPKSSKQVSDQEHTQGQQVQGSGFSHGQEQDKQNFLPEIPSHAQYLIIGGGTAAMSAFKAIRAKDPKAKVLVVTEEEYKPYMRPPLSKEMWFTEDEKLVSNLRFKQYNGNERSIFFLEDEFYTTPQTLNQNPNGGVAVVAGKRVTQVDVQNQTVRLDTNWEIAYDKCLIATGGKPKNLPIFEQQWDKLKEKVTLFRNIDDFKKLHAIAKEGKTIAIVGGGFLGSELACALGKFSKKYGGKVIQIFPESGNLRKVLPEYLSEWTTARVKEEGVEIIPKTNVNKAQVNDQKIELSLSPSKDAGNANQPAAKQWLLADHVVVAVGLEPNVHLATKSGFEIDSNLGGYLVNAELQARNNVWVAGDAACFYDIKLGRRRVEHHDHAVVSGRLAGENMTGAGKPYWHQSMFWSDLGPRIGFEAIGLVDSSLPTVGLFAKADESDTPQAQVNESNETLRSEVKDTKVPDVDGGASNDLRQPSSMDDYGKGVILYLKNETIVGVLLWNVFKRIPIARQLIQSQEKATNYAEMAKLFKINATGLEESTN